VETGNALLKRTARGGWVQPSRRVFFARGQIATPTSIFGFHVRLAALP
jgi:hypothetical protein